MLLRGGDQKRYRVLTEELKFDYVIRFRGNITVTSAAGDTRTAAAFVGPGGRARVLRDAFVKADRYHVGTVLCVQDKKMKQAWCLAASSTSATSRALMRYFRNGPGGVNPLDSTAFAICTPLRRHALRERAPR
jgi:hypothetical protein